jgi:hypothetical protein
MAVQKNSDKKQPQEKRVRLRFRFPVLLPITPDGLFSESYAKRMVRARLAEIV